MHIADLYRYPLKSAKGQALKKAHIGADGINGDRVWMVVDASGDQITARACPALLGITVDKDQLHFAQADPITLPTGGADRKAQLFSDDLIVASTPPEMSNWLSQALNRPAHLVAATPRTKRSYDAHDYAGFGDLAPVLITGTASLAHLNDLAPIDIEMARFRPNIVVQTQTPFEEDHWQTLRIGGVVFDVIEPCVRCNFTFLHPETGQRDITCEPLRSLSPFHADEQGGICFGVYAVPRGEGTLTCGDQVDVPAKTPRQFQKTDNPFEPLQGRRALRITSILPAAENAVHVELAFDDNQPTKISPGQFIALHFALPTGEELTRCYTVSRILHGGRALRISVRQEPDGIISGWLNTTARIGYSLWTSGVFGELTAPDGPALLLSAGSGITPFLAMKAHGGLHLHYERNKASVIGYDEAVQEDHFQLMLTPEKGRIADCHLPNGDLSGYEIRICGPAGFVDTAVKLLLDRNVSKAQIRTETFAIPPLVEGSSQDFQVHINETVVTVSQNKSLLYSLRENGIKVPSACEIGSCQTCRLRLISGEVLSTRDAAETGLLLSCCSYPRSDLVLETF